MERSISAAKHLLESVQKHADIQGVDHFHLMSLHGESGHTQMEWQYAYRLLVDSGHLIAESGSVQLTWNGHELLADLMARNR